MVSSILPKNKQQNYPNVPCLKFKYFEKATEFCKISTVDLSYVVIVKSTLEITQHFVAFSEFMNFNNCWSNMIRITLLPQKQLVLV